MAPTRTMPAGLISPNFQRIAANSTAQGLNSTSQLCHSFLFSVESANVRIRFDSMNSTTNPTANTGVLFTTTVQPYFLSGIGDASKIKIVKATGSPIVNITAFKYPSDK